MAPHRQLNADQADVVDLLALETKATGGPGAEPTPAAIELRLLREVLRILVDDRMGLNDYEDIERADRLLEGP